MPIYKYRTFEEAEKALWNLKPDKDYFKRVAGLWEFANKLYPISYPRGIFKFKTIEEANRHREEIEIAHAKKLRMRRKNMFDSDHSESSEMGKSSYTITFPKQQPE